MKLQALLGVACLVAGSRALAAGSTGVLGDWRGPADSVIRVAPCGGALCATLVRTGAAPATMPDSNNPDAALRARPLCGLQIGEGFHNADPNRAEGGHLYDPRTGRTYKGSMTSEGDVLLLRGYVGIGLFGKTARWERVTTPVELCVAAAGPGAAGAPAVPNAPAPPGTPPPSNAPTEPAVPAAPKPVPAPAAPAPSSAPAPQA